MLEPLPIVIKIRQYGTFNWHWTIDWPPASPNGIGNESSGSTFTLRGSVRQVSRTLRWHGTL